MAWYFLSAALAGALALGGTQAAVAASTQELEKEYNAHSMRAVPRDAFPVLTNPPMNGAAEGDKFFRANEWVIGVELKGVARAYPVTVMGIHELINDTVAGHPITVCW
jgi:hypothetical protein